MLRCELERMRPQRVPSRRTQGDNVLRLMGRSHLTDSERGACIASVMLLLDEIGHLRRTLRQSDRSIRNAQKRARNVIYV